MQCTIKCMQALCSFDACKYFPRVMLACIVFNWKKHWVCFNHALQEKKGMMPWFTLLQHEDFNESIPSVLTLHIIDLFLILICGKQPSLGDTDVNIMANVSKMQRLLFYFCDLELSMLIVMKGRIAYSHSYMSGAVRPPLQTLGVVNALLQMSLYISNNVTLNEEWCAHLLGLQ